MRYLALGCGLLLAGCSGGTAVSWPALTTMPAPVVRADEAASPSTTSMAVDEAFCALLDGVGGTLLSREMDDVEVLRVLRFATEFFVSAAEEAPSDVREDMGVVGHNAEVLANAFESGLIDRDLLEQDPLSFPGVNVGARERMAEYVESHCPGAPELSGLWELPGS